MSASTCSRYALAKVLASIAPGSELSYYVNILVVPRLQGKECESGVQSPGWSVPHANAPCSVEFAIGCEQGSFSLQEAEHASKFNNRIGPFVFGTLKCLPEFASQVKEPARYYLFYGDHSATSLDFQSALRKILAKVVRSTTKIVQASQISFGSMVGFMLRESFHQSQVPDKSAFGELPRVHDAKFHILIFEVMESGFPVGRIL